MKSRALVVFLFCMLFFALANFLSLREVPHAEGWVNEGFPLTYRVGGGFLGLVRFRPHIVALDVAIALCSSVLGALLVLSWTRSRFAALAAFAALIGVFFLVNYSTITDTPPLPSEIWSAGFPYSCFHYPGPFRPLVAVCDVAFALLVSVTAAFLSGRLFVNHRQQAALAKVDTRRQG